VQLLKVDFFPFLDGVKSCIFIIEAKSDELGHSKVAGLSLPMTLQ
jgi:hypothetical protein